MRVYVSTQLLGKAFDQSALDKVKGVSGVGRFRNADGPEIVHGCRARFNTVGEWEPYGDQTILLHHLWQIDAVWDELQAAGVKKLTVFLKYFTDKTFGTELSQGEIDLLHKLNASLAIDFVIEGEVSQIKL